MVAPLDRYTPNMVDGRTVNHPGTRAFISLAAFVVVAGGMKMAAGIVVPILAAVFIAVISVPPTAALVRIGIRGWPRCSSSPWWCSSASRRRR